MKEAFYIDSNVFITSILYEDSKYENVRNVLIKIEKGEIIAYTSTLTWDEVTWIIFKMMGKADSLAAGRKLITFPNLRFISIDENVISKSQTLRENYALDPSDAIHCACALERGIKRVITRDKHFMRVREMEVEAI